MESNPHSSVWIWRECHIDCAILDAKFEILKQVNLNCFASIKNKLIGGYSENVLPVYFRYYFKQHVSDALAKRFFIQILKWWDMDKILVETNPVSIVNLGYVTIDMHKQTLFDFQLSMTLVRYIEEFPFIVHGIFKNKSRLQCLENNYLPEFVRAHRQKYSKFKKSSSSWVNNLDCYVDCGHGLLSQYHLERSLYIHGIALWENNPDIIKRPSDTTSAFNRLQDDWHQRTFNINEIMAKYGKTQYV